MFHQGWTDIINCLALINYYSDKFEHIYLLAMEDAREIYEFYIRNISNITVIYIKQEDTRNPHIGGSYLKLGQTPLLFGIYDINRTDQYRSNFSLDHNPIDDFEFVNRFYSRYGLEPSIRIQYFNINRDYDIEDNKYKEVIGDKYQSYILYHDSIQVPLPIEKKDNYINLHYISNCFFDCIKILENAQEIILVDSVWSCICYILTLKYNLLSNIKITVYCKRGYYHMYKDVNKLSNWTII